ncbi:MAG: hypothetical protein Q6363_003915 [Candidatus Njordarchaeota archaeon]
MSFVVVFEDVKIIRSLFRGVSDLLSEANLFVDEEGLKVQGLDDSRVAMLSLRMPSSAFHSFDFEPQEGSEVIQIGLNFSDIKKIFAKAKAKDSVKLALVQEERPYFEITFFRGTIDDMTQVRRFKIPVLEVPAETIAPKELELDVTVEFATGSWIADLVESASIVADDLQVVASKEEEKITFIAEGELGKFEYPVDLSRDETVMRSEIQNDARAIYSLDYLKKMDTPAKIADSVIIRFSSNMPMELSYLVGGGFELKYLLAPRVI